MGTCASAAGVGCCRPKYRRPDEAAASNLDISALDLDALLRRGIAEAQRATVARQSQKDRLRHIRTARRLLKEALQRCGHDEPDLFVHLSAVLLKLGEDPREMRGLLAEYGNNCGPREPVNASNSTGAAGPSPQASGARTPSGGSSRDEVADGVARLCDDDELGHVLLEESEEDCPLATGYSPTTPASSLEPSTESPRGPANTNASEVLVESGVRLRIAPLSTVQEHDEAGCNGGDAVGSKPVKVTASPQMTPPSVSLPGPTDSRGSSAPVSAQPSRTEPQESSDEQCASDERVLSTEVNLNESDSSSHSPARSPLPARSCAPWSPHLEDAPGSMSPPPPTNGVEQLLVGEDKEKIVDMQDAVSCLQAVAEKRRHAQMGGKQSKRQPSQSSSYSSQGAVSDSDGSNGPAKRGCLAFAGSKPQTPGLEMASPSPDSGVKNPLSQAELLFSALGKGVSSPCPQSQSQVSDTFSIAGSPAASTVPSASPSAHPSPYAHAAVPLTEVAPPPNDGICVKIINGVSGDEEVRFFVAIEESFSEQHFLSILERLCKQHTGHPLSGLNWLSPAASGDRYQRRKCDLHMVEEVISSEGTLKKDQTTMLLLCTVPVKPPSELEFCKVRLRTLAPPRIASGMEKQIRLKLETSLLEASHVYTVAFTHQVSMLTHMADATLLKSLRGVELSVPLEMIAASNQRTTDGLYDVYLVINNTFRSENRRSLTVGSAESELSSSSAGHMTSSSFMPIATVRGNVAMAHLDPAAIAKPSFR